MYTDASTSLGSFAVDIPIRRGVKQRIFFTIPLQHGVGCPHQKTPQLRSGLPGRWGEDRSTVFADNMVLFSTSGKEMLELTRMTKRFMVETGMARSVGKCSEFWSREKGAKPGSPRTLVLQ